MINFFINKNNFNYINNFINNNCYIVLTNKYCIIINSSCIKDFTFCKNKILIKKNFFNLKINSLWNLIYKKYHFKKYFFKLKDINILLNSKSLFNEIYSTFLYCLIEILNIIKYNKIQILNTKIQFNKNQIYLLVLKDIIFNLISSLTLTLSKISGINFKILVLKIEELIFNDINDRIFKIYSRYYYFNDNIIYELNKKKIINKSYDQLKIVKNINLNLNDINFLNICFLLNEINNKKNPKDKLNLIKKSINEIVKFLKINKLKGSADNIIPLLSYLIAKSNLNNPYSNAFYIKDFIFDNKGIDNYIISCFLICIESINLEIKNYIKIPDFLIK
tara:strand:+ start:3666 stop:4667 length:1002 start_codon:yes stop_codon:yes gene_type:complete